MTTPEHQWKPGQSGNPNGRPKGSLNKKTQIATALMESGKEIARVVCEKALEGDMQAANIVLSRLQPPLRSRAERVNFKLDSDAPLTQQARQVLEAVSTGDIDPETGKLLIDSISSFAKLREQDELATRLELIEMTLNRAHDIQPPLLPVGVPK